MEKEILLDVQHLSIGFESYNAKVEKIFFNAISDLSLTVRKGEIVAIVGSSGSGKSLLAHAVMNILPDNARTGGTISIHCRADRPSSGIVNLYFTIDDNGADIPERGMQAIFDAGQRAESDTAVLPSLYAAQEAAALMGGSLDARSSAGITRFSLTVAVRVK